MYNDMNDFKILEMSEMKKETKNSKKKKPKNISDVNIVNKKVRGIIFILFGIFLIYLLLDRVNIQNSKTSILTILLHFTLFIFGKMSFYVSILIMGIGLFDFFFGEVKLKFHKSKLISLVVLFISLSILYIKEFIKTPLSSSFIEAGRKLLEIGFNKESGGFIGALSSMPLFKIIHLKIIGYRMNGLIYLTLKLF